MDVERFGRRMIELMPQLIRGFTRHEHNSLSRGEITLPQLWALEHLSLHREPCAMNELAGSLGISRPAATGLIDRLISQRLVRRDADPHDRRVVRISITQKGTRAIQSIWEQKRRAVVRIFGQLSSGDRTQYLATLEQVVRILQDQGSSGQPSITRGGRPRRSSR